MFSNFASSKGKGKEKGKGKDEGGKSKGKGKPVFESQKERDKWLAQQKAAQAKANADANGPGNASSPTKAASAESSSTLWQKSETPSYVHGIFCLTRDDHLALEPLLNPGQQPVAATQEQSEEMGLPSDILDEASDHLRHLGFSVNRIRTALNTVGPQVVHEAEERETVVTVRTAAERALEWLCSVSSPDCLPSRLQEPREVTQQRKRQEERNSILQSRALLLGGNLNANHIARIEKLGFSRARAIEALANAPEQDLLEAVKALLSDFFPLEVAPDAEVQATSWQDLQDEAEAMQSIYGEDEVHIMAHYGNFELQLRIPGTDWAVAVMIPEGLPYPMVAPLICPRHPRLREAARPRLLGAMGDVCRDVLGSPMLFTICEWLQSDGERFLVPVSAEEAEVAEPRQTAFAGSAKALHQYKAIERCEERDRQEAEVAKARNLEERRRLQLEEERASGPKLKDKIAIEIREDPGAAGQHDLAGYDDHHVRELVREAFGTPILGTKMVRISFVIGGGKAIRGKYSESLGKALGAALQEFGYEQDTTASATWECGGKFKGQHDTQKNLKLVHVFPKMKSPDGGDDAQHREESVSETHRRLAGAAYADFVQEVLPWTKSREVRPKAEALLQYLNETAQELERIETALSSGKDVGEAKRQLYDELGSAEDLLERSRWLAVTLSPKPRADNGVNGPDGTTLTFEAPSRLAEAISLESKEEATSPSDVATLQRKIAQVQGESSRLRRAFAQPKTLDDIRHGLPAWAKREEIQRAIRERQVVVVEGDTGCGKSTQVPQFILEDWVSRDEGAAVNIIMTQPRRISAIGVADRIAHELDSTIGDLCGYSIRLESKKSKNTRILVCTTGVVLRRLEADRELRGVTHIVVDECHERDLDTDFLLTVLRDLLPSRPALKIILMSATINAQIFKDYFSGCQAISIPGRTFPVTTYYVEHALEHTGFVVEPNGEYSRKDADELTSYEVQELRDVYERDECKALIGDMSVSTHVIHQMHRLDPEQINFDLVAAVVRHIHTKVDPMTKGKSAGAILVFVPGFGEIKKCVRAISDEDPRQHRWSSSGANNWSSSGTSNSSSGLWVLPLHSMINVSEQRKVFQRPAPGLRKVVVTTNIAETSITIDDVEYVVDCGRHKQTKYDPQNRVSMLVDCMETKANAKQRRGRAGRVKSGVCYHLMNVRKWKRLEDFEKPEMLRVPLDSLCLRISLLKLGHPAKFLAKSLTPPTDAAVRSSLQQLVDLSAVELQQRHRPGEDQGNDKDDQERLLKGKLRLTPLGTQLAQLPVDAGVGKLLVLGCLFGFPKEVAVLASALSMRSPFLLGVGENKEAVDKRRKELAGDLESDHLLLVTLFEKWEQLGKKTANARQWCRANYLDMQTFESVSEQCKHLLGILNEQGFTSRKREAEAETSKSRNRLDSVWMPPCLSCIMSATEEFERRKLQLLRSLLAAALWPNVVLRQETNVQLFAQKQAGLTFHPASILALQAAAQAEEAAGDWHCPQCNFRNFGSREWCRMCETSKPPPPPKKTQPIRHRAFMYSQKTRSVGNPATGQKAQTYVRDCTGVTMKALFLLGHKVDPDYLSGRACVDSWIHSLAAPRDVAMMLGLRRQFQQVLSHSLSRTDSATDTLNDHDRQVIDVMTTMLVLDVE